ncbi:hypothetical protein [Microbacterium sp.]|uniref:hypothetical protein n=1 Tax=Microbacterium sp. TaxID=51671 RepID=UPI002852B054|nr:hypothetical protein [Microbacterium sp.]
MTDDGWRVTVTPKAAMVLHRRYGKPSFVTATLGFWGTLHAERGQLRLMGHNDLVAVISEIEQVGTDQVYTGSGMFFPGLVVTIAGGEKLPLLPLERPGLLPHVRTDPSAIAAEIRAVVFGDA